MKSDVEVLDEAIAILETEGMWCQGGRYKASVSGNKFHDMRMSNTRLAMENRDISIVGMCAEGAIRWASEHYWFSNRDYQEIRSRFDQSERIENAVAQNLMAIRPDICDRTRLDELNDHDTMRASDIILAMKQTREDLM